MKSFLTISVVIWALILLADAQLPPACPCPTNPCVISGNARFVNFPASSYFARGCSYLIDSGVGNVASIKFNSFDSIPSNDTLLVFDGAAQNAPLIRGFTGRNLPNAMLPPLQSTQRFLFLFWSETTNPPPAGAPPLPSPPQGFNFNVSIGPIINPPFPSAPLTAYVTSITYESVFLRWSIPLMGIATSYRVEGSLNSQFTNSPFPVNIVINPLTVGAPPPLAINITSAHGLTTNQTWFFRVSSIGQNGGAWNSRTPSLGPFLTVSAARGGGGGGILPIPQIIPQPLSFGSAVPPRSLPPTVPGNIWTFQLTVPAPLVASATINIFPGAPPAIGGLQVTPISVTIPQGSTTSPVITITALPISVPTVTSINFVSSSLAVMLPPALPIATGPLPVPAAGCMSATYNKNTQNLTVSWRPFTVRQNVSSDMQFYIASYNLKIAGILNDFQLVGGPSSSSASLTVSLPPPGPYFMVLQALDNNDNAVTCTLNYIPGTFGQEISALNRTQIQAVLGQGGLSGGGINAPPIPFNLNVPPIQQGAPQYFTSLALQSANNFTNPNAPMQNGLVNPQVRRPPPPRPNSPPPVPVPGASFVIDAVNNGSVLPSAAFNPNDPVFITLDLSAAFSNGTGGGNMSLVDLPRARLFLYNTVSNEWQDAASFCTSPLQQVNVTARTLTVGLCHFTQFATFIVDTSPALSSTSLSGGAIAGIVIGAVVFAVLIAVGIRFWKKSSKKAHKKAEKHGKEMHVIAVKTG